MNRKKRAVMKFDGISSAMIVLRGRDMRGKTALITGGNSGIGTFNSLNHLFVLICLVN